MKKYLQTSMGDLKIVMEKVDLLLTNQHVQHGASMGQAKDRTPQQLMIPLFAELVGRVTPFALLKVLGQYDMLASKDLPPCHHLLRKSMGVPCHHKI